MAEKKKAFSIADYVKPEDVSNLDRVEIDKIVGIPIGDVVENEKNFYDTSNVTEVVNSIALNGLLEPILVMPTEGEKKYRIISGHRRFKAFSQLHEDNPEKYAEIPAIIKSPKNEVVEELMLIEANSATRVMSSADTMKQAERYKELLAGLKESGVEIPGRLRDVVADAMQVSASRLARLDVIRKGLTPENMKLFEKGKINESVAYELAKLDSDLQQKMVATKEDPRYLYQGTVANAAGYFKGLLVIKCPETKGNCENREAMLDEMIRPDNYGWMPCKSKPQCCSKCDKLYSCKAACPKFGEQIKKHKAEERQAKKEARSIEKTESENRAARNSVFWIREAYARERAGVSIEDFKTAIDRRYMRDELLQNLENGYAGDDSHGSLMLDLTAEQYIKLANLYNCSIDFLLCRTDEP